MQIGSHRIVSDMPAGLLRRFALDTFKATWSSAMHTKRISGFAQSPDAQYIATPCDDNTCGVWRADGLLDACIGFKAIR